MSYWAEFAYTGNPGRGRDGGEPNWTAWQNEPQTAQRLLIIDSELGAGIRMSSEQISVADLKQRFFADNSFTDDEYCEAYKTLFLRANYVEQEYANLVDGGCP